MKKSSVPTVLAFFFILIPFIAHSQDLKKSTNLDSCLLKDVVTFLSDDYLEGRGTGTVGQMLAGSMIEREFDRNNMIPFYHMTFTQSFKKDTLIGRNIIGVVRAKYYSEKYIVISAHYDHLGKLGGKIYNGADDNASGVAALITLAKYYCDMRATGEGAPVNIIFAAFDAKEHNMAGSEEFIKKLPIPKRDIICNINLDQLGSIFAPPTKDTSYVLVLGAKNRGRYKGFIESARGRMEKEIYVCYDYYNSPTFAEIFYKTSDQHSFVKADIPALLFTSGIHMHTYKPTDDHYFINYQVLMTRTILVRNLINIIASYI